MSEKDKKISNKRLFNLLLELNHRLINISNKIDDLSPSEDIYFDMDGISPILMPEDVYLEICDELGEDFLEFMGIS